jgi:hypothetical protein
VANVAGELEGGLTAARPARAVSAARSPWIRGPAWDLALLSFAWVPFFVLFVFGMHLGHGGDPGIPIVHRPEFATAVLIDLGLIFAHRHYVVLMVFGDKRTFEKRPRAFIASAVLIVSATLFAWLLRGTAPAVWSTVFIVQVLWNIWHTIMQRYGIGRIYAGRVGAGLEAGEHGARDRRLLWSAVLLVATGLIVTRSDLLRGTKTTEAILRTVEPVLHSGVSIVVLAVVAIAFLSACVSWASAELDAKIPFRDRVPRLAFLGSTLLLLVIMYVYGPIVGFLVFGTAHAIEYIAFVHHFAGRSYEGRSDGLAVRILRHPLRSALVLVPFSFCLYAWMRMTGITLLAVFVIYEVSLAMVHFAYDGWVWKARSPALKKPLELT